MPTTQKNKKGCDDSCVGPECSHPLCHEGESNGTKLIQCEECGQRFCIPHLIEGELSIFLCADCDAESKDADVHADAAELVQYREIESQSEVN